MIQKSLLLALAACLFALPAIGRAQDATAAAPSTGWPESVNRALDEAGTNRTEIARALNGVSGKQREGMRFLVENMPTRDLQTLSAAYLTENVTRAYEAFERAPWREQVPQSIFLNDVLPYASLNESRDDWRAKLSALAEPIVTGAKTPSEAAQRLNQQLFAKTGVGYSTQRRRPDQGPLETLESGKATCTGLSILLVDACRAVGIPARVVGTPLWFNKRGNHTWVEIWDGDWHFTGAAEADPAGLNRGWFAHDASQALADVPEHAIYASSFARTGLSFSLVWARRNHEVPAVNVTSRYAPAQRVPEPDQVRLLVQVTERAGGPRVEAKVVVVETGGVGLSLEGMSRGETADLNDILPFVLPRDRSYEVRVEHAGRSLHQVFRADGQPQTLLTFRLVEAGLAVAAKACCAEPAGSPLKADDQAKLVEALTQFFSASASDRAAWKFPRALENLLRDRAPAVRQIAWETYQASAIHVETERHFEAREVHSEGHHSPYTLKTVGTRPAQGWALFIAMHGGGGVPKEFNDRQWQHMQIYYRDQPEAGGYLYVALRAPNDSWNGFYDGYVYPLIANLVRQFLLFGDVDPNKVFLMGYSHGGYGAYAIGPKMPDRFAAIHASAAAPTDGETTAKTLRHSNFTAMIGEKDTMYGRYDRNVRFQEELDALRGHRTDIYPARVQVISGHGHSGLPDRDKIADMYPVVRRAVPRDLSWLMTDSVITDFYWLRCDAPAKQAQIEAVCRENEVTLKTEGVQSVRVLLDERLIDFRKPVLVELNGRSLPPVKLHPSLRVLGETLLRRGDPELAFTAELVIPSSGERAAR